MARIRIIEESEAEGTLAAQYAAARGRAGKVFQVLKLHSLEPATLDAMIRMYGATTTGPRAPLPRTTRELIAVLVSRTNNCDY